MLTDDTQIAPAARYAITIVFIGNIKAANEDNGFVADQQLTMVAHTKSPEVRRIKSANLGAGGHERNEKISRQKPGADGIHQHTHAHAASSRRQQRFQKQTPQLAVGIDIRFQLEDRTSVL